jgi:hypothetical protein
MKTFACSYAKSSPSNSTTTIACIRMTTSTEVLFREDPKI